jgi:hypothetical protein
MSPEAQPIILEHSFMVEDLRIIEIHASADGYSEDDPHLNWFVSFASQPEPDDDSHVVIGSIHVREPECMSDVVVGGLFTPLDASRGLVGNDELFGQELAKSSALETLYDFGRHTLAGVLGSMEVDYRLPLKSPDPEVGVASAEDVAAADESHID